MKPQKLVMSAFGSYAEETVVDFSQVNHGIFLITGDTGSGKTTIFDAICYALYDRASGVARETSDMRSQYAKSEIPTFVEYTFTYGEDIYVIKRNPKYSRLSKRKDKDGNYKETVEQPGVELTMPDGRIFPGKLKETNEKIIEIIGLDADQFTQIAMIAQGEFMKLLQASSNKRKEIFSKIFDTRIYWQIQEELRRRTKNIYGELEDNRKNCEQELASVRLLPFQERLEEAVEFTFLEHDLDGTLKRLENLLADGIEKEQEQKGKLEEWQVQIEAKNSALAEARQINELWEQLEQALAKSKQLEEAREEILTIEKRLEQAKKAAIVKAEEDRYKAGQEALMESAKRLTTYEDMLKETQKQVQILEERKLLSQKLLQEKEPEYQQQKLRIEDSMPFYEKIQVLAKEQKALENQLIVIEEAVKQKQGLLSQTQKKLIEKHESTGKALQYYQELNDTFVAEQAGIMAATLQENMPCPVCGSTIHPRKATLSEKAVTQVQVNQAKKDWQAKDEEERLCSEKVTVLREELETQQKEQQTKKSDVENVRRQYELLLDKLPFASEQEAKKKLTELAGKLEELQNATKKAEAQWQEATREQALLSGKIDVETEQKKHLIQEETSLLQIYVEMVAQQSFTDEEEYRRALCSDEQRNIWEQEKTAYREQCVRNESMVKQLEMQTRDKERKNTQQLSEELHFLQQQRKQLEEENKVLYGVNQRNEEAHQKLKKAFAKREQLKQEYQLYSSLDKTANGNLAGTAKLDFQTYIQRRFFEMIIREANKRLIKMTSNQFILQCRNIDKLSSQGAVGLDLDVYSLVNDRTRDVKTLSGGESFMAALAMALGMSDVIQNTAGRVKLETMFLDEGFGSLDDESRGEAIKILQELAGNKRLVGIISHVTELKEQIDCKLVVSKNEQGSKVAWILDR